MDLGISGKRALIVGGSSGLGLAAANALASEGVAIAIFSRDVARLEKACHVVGQLGVEAKGHSGDIASNDDILALADWLKWTGGLDILVLNTPRPPSPMRAFLAEDDDERWEQGYRDQLQSALRLLRAVTPLMLNKGWGRIIGVTSASVKQPMARHALSSVFRAGVQAALKHLVEEVAPHGITVNAVAPATILTPTFSSFHDLERRISEIPLRRAGTLEEFGGTVAFLASQSAGFITGQTIQLDGGMTRSLV